MIHLDVTELRFSGFLYLGIQSGARQLLYRYLVDARSEEVELRIRAARLDTSDLRSKIRRGYHETD